MRCYSDRHGNSGDETCITCAVGETVGEGVELSFAGASVGALEGEPVGLELGAFDRGAVGWQRLETE